MDSTASQAREPSTPQPSQGARTLNLTPQPFAGRENWRLHSHKGRENAETHITTGTKCSWACFPQQDHTVGEVNAALTEMPIGQPMYR